MSNHEETLKRVNEALKHNKELADCHINPSVENGKVTLSGNVKSAELSQKAEEAVSRVSGVETVRNNLRVEEKNGAQSKHEKQDTDHHPAYGSGQKGYDSLRQQNAQMQGQGKQSPPGSGMKEEKQKQPEKNGQPHPKNEAPQGGRPQDKNEGKQNKR